LPLVRKKQKSKKDALTHHRRNNRKELLGQQWGEKEKRGTKVGTLKASLELIEKKYTTFSRKIEV